MDHYTVQALVEEYKELAKILKAIELDMNLIQHYAICSIILADELVSSKVYEPYLHVSTSC